MIKQAFKRKRPDASNDYSKAYNMAERMTPGQAETIIVDSPARFRKYLHEAAGRRNKVFRTSVKQDKSLIIRCFE